VVPAGGQCDQAAVRSGLGADGKGFRSCDGRGLPAMGGLMSVVERKCARREHLQLRGFNVDLDDAGHREIASQSRVTVGTSSVVRRPPVWVVPKPSRWLVDRLRLVTWNRVTRTRRARLSPPPFANGATAPSIKAYDLDLI
jgi:hypothetical protein